jgi:hypothetical protein
VITLAILQEYEQRVEIFRKCVESFGGVYVSLKPLSGVGITSYLHILFEFRKKINMWGEKMLNYVWFGFKTEKKMRETTVCEIGILTNVSENIYAKW